MKLLREMINAIRALYQLMVRPMIWRNNVKGTMPSRVGKGTEINARKKGSIHSKKGLKVGKSAILSALNGGKIVLGENVGIGDNCQIIAHDSIVIQDGAMLAPNVFIYDHDHDFRVGIRMMKYKTAPVYIGKNCWIGANVVILRGTHLGDNCVVGASSVISGTYSANSLIVQKRETTVKTYETT